MSAPYDGGSAFPNTVPDQEHTPFYCHHHGMTLRDWFAGKALQGICSQKAWELCSPEKIAEWAFNHADAMLEARNK